MQRELIFIGDVSPQHKTSAPKVYGSNAGKRRNSGEEETKKPAFQRAF